MNDITTIGLDLAKSVFHVVCCNRNGKVIKKKTLRRKQVAAYFMQLPPCQVAMEASSGAHYWARTLSSQGHNVMLIPAQHVKAYVRGQKNDYNDAQAIAEASRVPAMPTVMVKSIAQQDLQALQRMRQQAVRQRTAMTNHLRGLLSEYGIVVGKGLSALRKALPGILEDAENELSDFFRTLLARRWQQLQQVDEDITYYNKSLQRCVEQDTGCQNLLTIPGYGPVLAAAFRSHFGNGSHFKRGRDAAASVGLVPRQHSSGGKTMLLNITKTGDKYLRSLLVHGARAVINHADKKEDTLSLWIQGVEARRGRRKAIVALANKLARIGWSILNHGNTYDVEYHRHLACIR